ncbi:TPA: hypothetical protein DCX16_01725 [bacterium]|nr:hypothetical protein [bacterium]
MKNNKIFIVIIVIIALIAVRTIHLGSKKKPKVVKKTQIENCKNIPPLPDGASKLVTKVIDGDTFLIEGGYSVRILGIDADERGYPCYQAAKDRLEELILNKKIRPEKGKKDKDQWCRYLRYVFIDDKNISLELVREGLAIARFSPEDIKYKEEIIEAERIARENKIGCKWGRVEVKDKFGWEKLTRELTGLKIIHVCRAKNYLGKEVIVEGKVVDTHRSKKDVIFLNFEKPYPNQCFTAVIFSQNQHRFVSLPEKYYLYKTVRIKGKIEEYKGKPQIILEDSTQIELEE